MMKPIRSLLLFACVHATVHAGDQAYSSIPEFVATLPAARLLDARAVGTLNDGNAIYHAQLVELGNDRTQQILVFRRDDSGNYVLADRSGIMEDMGGSGNWTLRNIEFRNASLYISFAYAWHQCSGWSENQFRFVNGRLAMIGSESEEENIDKGLTVRSSSNLLTGQGYWIGEKNGIAKKHLDNSIKGAKPFSVYDGGGWISPYHTKRRVC
jgi:hypothetical protein